MIADVLLSIFGGGVTGILGSLANSVVSIYEKKKEREFILEKHKLDAEIRAKETESEKEIMAINASQKAITASYRHDSSIQGTSFWVQNVRALVRPFLTVYLISLVTIIWFTAPITIDRNLIIQSILYATSTAIFWWFGDRVRKN